MSAKQPTLAEHYAATKAPLFAVSARCRQLAGTGGSAAELAAAEDELRSVIRDFDDMAANARIKGSRQELYPDSR
jgi:hypothetical protein